MTTLIDMPSERAVWLEFRDRYWNASDTAALFGEHPYSTLADVAVRKLTGKRQAETAVMTRGHRLESAVAEWWGDDHGIKVYPADRLFLHDELVLATPDYLIVGCDDEVVEVKTTARTVFEPDRYWWWQCQAQCLAGDLRRVHLAVLDRSMDLQCFVVERDEHATEAIVERARVFMTAIHEGVMPDGVVLAYEHHLALHPTSSEEVVDLDDDQVALVRRLGATRSLKRQAEAEEERVRTELAAILGDADTAQHEGRVVLTWKSASRSRLDDRELRHQHPDLADAFTITTSYRTMRISS